MRVAPKITLLACALFVLTAVPSILTSNHAVADERETEAAVKAPTDIRPPAEAKAATDIKPQTVVRSPFEMVRSLDALQDQIVKGNVAAQRAIPNVISQIGDRLLVADPQSWHQAKNARAVVTYTLSGGQVKVIQKVIQIGNAPELEKKLMEGALAYVEGREAKASQLLIDINAKSLPPALGGHLALVQAMLLSHDDPAKSNELLDLARILAPGTLVEETALRREVFNLSDGGDLNKFILLSSQYLRRFPNSLYAENFKQKFGTTVTHLGMTDSPEQFAKVVQAIGNLESEDRLHLYMLIAQSAILGGNAMIAQLAAERAMTIAKDGSQDGVRAKLFNAAALILTNNYDQGIVKLKELDAVQISKRDADFKSAILAMAKQIRQWPELANSDDDAEPKPNLKAPGHDGTVAASAGPVIDLAQKAISDTDRLLQEKAH
jgi:chemotaxis protein MotC